MNNKIKKLIPTLRFPEFVNNDNWTAHTLGEVADFRRGSFPQPYGLPEWYDNENGLPFIQVYDVDNNFRLKPKTKSKISKLASLQSVFIKKGTVIITIQGSIGRVAITQYDAYIDRTLLIFQRFLKEIDKYFFSYVLFLLFEIEKEKAPGGIIKTITKEVLSDFLISIPSLFEQHKIANCLLSLDELITAQKEKLELLKNHKKGLMQNLFPQEGETVPKFRFPEFENDGDWAEKKLETLAKRGSGHTPNKQFPEYYNGGINWVSLSDSKKLDNGYIYETNIQISMSGVKNSSAVLHPAGTVILSRDAGVGKSAVLNSEMAVSQHFIAWVCDESLFSNWFLYYILQILKPVFENIAVGSTIKTIGIPFFKELRIAIPLISEQKKIAETLLSVDRLIQQLSDKIEKLQLHKKGLMQGLFPKTID